MGIAVEYESNNVLGKLSTTLNHTTEQLKGCIGDLSMIVNHIAQGNRSVENSVKYQEDFVTIKNSLNGIQLSLSDFVYIIHQVSEQAASELNKWPIEYSYFPMVL